jgi:hypothetical protein
VKSGSLEGIELWSQFHAAESKRGSST